MTDYIHLNMTARKVDGSDLTDKERHEFLIEVIKAARPIAKDLGIWIVGGGSKKAVAPDAPKDTAVENMADGRYTRGDGVEIIVKDGQLVEAQGLTIDEAELIEVSRMKDGSLDPTIRVISCGPEESVTQEYSSQEELNVAQHSELPDDGHDHPDEYLDHVHGLGELTGGCCGPDGCTCQAAQIIEIERPSDD